MRQRRRLVAVLLLSAVVLGAIVIGVVVVTRAPPLTPAEVAALAARAAARRLLAEETKNLAGVRRLVAVPLPKKEGAPAPGPAGSLFVSPLPSHQVVGFVPYWELGSLHAGDYANSSELVYSGVCPSASGGLLKTSRDCSLGLGDLGSSGFQSFVADAHGAGDRVLLSLTTTSTSVIRALDAKPAARAGTLAPVLVAIVRTYDLDGVNIDIEGSSAADAHGFVGFVSALVGQLRRLDPPGEIVIDTYASSAGTTGFFDLRKLAPLADEVFLMAYDLYSPFNASANSPLVSPTLGYSVIQSLIQYEKVMPAGKIVLGLPLYGNDFQTASAKPGASAVSSAPEAFSYGAIAAAGYPPRWDVASDTPYSVFRRAGVWHQIWFDDAVSLALKTAAASELHVAGVGAWAFGMEGRDSGLLAALDGGAAPQRASLSPPP